MIDFSLLQNSTENPTVMSILLTVTFSFALSSLIVFTYDVTTKAIERPLHFLQSLALVSIVAATVMQAVGDSLARGLGMLGALAIIRFRTSLKDPRNMTFMFASLAVGISCGVNGYEIAIIGTIAFCVVAFLLKFTPFSNVERLTGVLRYTIPQDSFNNDRVQYVLKEYCNGYRLMQYNLKAEEKPVIQEPEVAGDSYGSALKKPEVLERIDKIEIKYYISLNKIEDSNHLVNELMRTEGIGAVRLSFSEPEISL